MADDGFSQKTQDFVSWFKSQPGTTFHNDIEIRDLRQNGAGRGMIATSDIPADTVLFTIPRDTILSKETSPLTTLLPQIFKPTAATATKATGNDDDDDLSMNGASDAEDDETAQDSWTSLILILIHAHLQGPASKWAPYLAILPQAPADFNTPMFWTDAETAELQASPVVSKIGRAEAKTMIRTKILPVIRAHPDVFFPPNTSTPPPTDDDLIQLAFRMGSIIMAYAFDLEPDTSPSPSPEPNTTTNSEDNDGWEEDHAPQSLAAASSPLGMVPMADILNADAAFNAHIAHHPTHLTATTLRNIPAGAEVLNYYGPLSTGELVRRYGYATPAHARWDLVDLDWKPHILPALRAELGKQLVSDEQWEQVVAAFHEEDDFGTEDDDGFVLEKRAADPDFEGRVAPVTAPADIDEDLLAQGKAFMAHVKRVKPAAVPDKNARDRVLYGAVGRAVEARAREYGTSLAEDEELVAREGGSGSGWSARRKMAMAVRIGEKKVLKEVGQSVLRRLAALSLAERDGDGRSAKRRRME